MADQSVPPSDSENDSRENAANKRASSKEGGDPKKQLKIRKPRSTTIFGLKKSKWRDFAGYAILIPWLGYDLSEAHGIVKILLVFISLTSAILLAGSYFHQFRNKLTFWLIGIIASGLAALNDLRPDPKPHLGIGISFSRTNFVWLTNRCLVPAWSSTETAWSFTKPISSKFPWLIIPASPNQSNIVFNPLITNGPESIAENVVVHIQIIGNVRFTSDSAWASVGEDGQYMDLEWKGEYVKAGTSHRLPQITVALPLDLTNRWQAGRAPMRIKMESKNGSWENLVFWAIVITNLPSDLTNMPLTLYCPNEISFDESNITMSFPLPK